MINNQQQTGELFREIFGRTTLTARLDDILREAMELHRYSDISNLREEAGDLLCSLLALCHECGFNSDELISDTWEKIKERENQYRTLGRKLNVAILGGAFDPPHLGHIAVAQFILESSRTFDEVWLCPCYQHMHNKKMAHHDHRLKMCELATARDGRLRAFDFEIKNQLKGETYNFVQRLINDSDWNQEYNFSLVIGMDNANQFDTWVNFKELERAIRFVVIPRSGEQPNPKVNWYLKPPHIYLHPDLPLVETSSTTVRSLVEKVTYLTSTTQERAKLLKIVNPEVLDYILDNSLYSSVVTST